MKMYAELKITFGPPEDEVTILHMSPINSLNDIKKFPQQIAEMSMDFLVLDETPLPLSPKKEKRMLMVDKVKYVDD